MSYLLYSVNVVVFYIWAWYNWVIKRKKSLCLLKSKFIKFPFKETEDQNGEKKRGKFFHKTCYTISLFSSLWVDALTLIIMYFTDSFSPLSVSCIVYSVWTFLGYIFRWKHIYCSYQNAYHNTMTPNTVDWDNVKKTDAYGIPIVFMLFGIGLLLI